MYEISGEILDITIEMYENLSWTSEISIEI